MTAFLHGLHMPEVVDQVRRGGIANMEALRRVNDEDLTRFGVPPRRRARLLELLQRGPSDEL